MLWNSASASSPIRARSGHERGRERRLRQRRRGQVDSARGADAARAGQMAHRLGLPRALGQQPLADVRVVIRAIQRLLESPVQQVARRCGLLQRLELAQGAVHAGVGRQRASPVLLERHQAGRERVGEPVADEVPAVLAQRLGRLAVAVPAQGAPDDLVHVVVAAFRVGDKADGMTIQRAVDRRLVEGPRVDWLAVGRLRMGEVPVGHGVLRRRLCVMSG